MPVEPADDGVPESRLPVSVGSRVTVPSWMFASAAGPCPPCVSSVPGVSWSCMCFTPWSSIRGGGTVVPSPVAWWLGRPWIATAANPEALHLHTTRAWGSAGPWTSPARPSRHVPIRSATAAEVAERREGDDDDDHVGPGDPRMHPYASRSGSSRPWHCSRLARAGPRVRGSACTTCVGTCHEAVMRGAALGMP